MNTDVHVPCSVEQVGLVSVDGDTNHDAARQNERESHFSYGTPVHGLLTARSSRLASVRTTGSAT